MTLSRLISIPTTASSVRSVCEEAQQALDLIQRETDEAVVGIEIKRDKVFDHYLDRLNDHVTKGNPPITSWELEEALTGWPSILFKVRRHFLVPA